MKTRKNIGSQMIINDLTKFDKDVFERTVYNECEELWELFQNNFLMNYDYQTRPKVKMRIHITFEEFRLGD